jgi:hypothetical protein
MPTLLRLDLDRIWTNLSRRAGLPLTDDEVLRELSARGVWRHSDQWWGTNDGAAERFSPGEILEQRDGDGPGAACGKKLDAQARRELDEETQRHREALSGLTANQVDAVVAEANRHLGRVNEIMRAMVGRASDVARLVALASLCGLCGLCAA